MLYLIGLGLGERGISIEGLELVKKCSQVYLESYTVDFPYSIESLEKSLGKKIIKLDRAKVESDYLVKESGKNDVALLVYGSPLFATTHETLLLDCRKAKIKTRVICSASVFDALGETGLELYKFGKITSMPKWQKNFEPDSFIDVVKDNLKINAHSLILCDIGLGFHDALEQLEKSLKGKKLSVDKIVIASLLGLGGARILYGNIENLKKIKELKNPFCIVIPCKLHFVEQESLETLANHSLF